MTPTRPRLLALIALVAGVLGWVIATIADSILARYLPVPWTAALAMWLLGAALLIWTWLARPRLLRRPGAEPLPPITAARTAALALAASRVGAGVAGFYLGVAIVFVADLPVPAAQTGAWASGATALAGAAIVGVALWLESLCRIGGDDDDEEAVDLRGLPGGASGGAERTSLVQRRPAPRPPGSRG